jgi:hypothetical protein
MSQQTDEHQEPRRWRDRPVRLASVAVGVVITTLLGLFVGAVVQRYGLFDFLGNQPSAAEQLDEVRHDLAVDHRRLVSSRRVDLHGNGEDSYLLVFRDTTVSFGGFYPKRSDLVRIYDTRAGGKLRLAYQFEPAVRPPLREVYVFTLRSLEDIDEDGRNDVLGAWEVFAMQPVLPRPIVIRWDDATSKYVAIPLLPSPSTVYSYKKVTTGRESLLPARGVFARGARRAYRRSVTLIDRDSNARLRLYATEEFSLSRSKYGTRLLVAAYVIRQNAHADLGTYQILPWSFSLIGSEAQVFACSTPSSSRGRGNRPILFRPQGPVLPRLVARWRRAAPRTHNPSTAEKLAGQQPDELLRGRLIFSAPSLSNG